MKTGPPFLEKSEPNAVAEAGSFSSPVNEVFLKRRSASGPNQLYTIDEIHNRAETMTPLLETIPNIRSPRR
jgi:hypothetical protein